MAGTPCTAHVEVAEPDEGTRRLQALRQWVAPEMSRVECELAACGVVGGRVGRSVERMLAVPGKRLRPLCTVIAAKLGGEVGVDGIDLATASELVHAATLLHDDVIDVGEKRRGRPTARLLEGNAASVLAGDWLLCQALERIRRTQRAGPPDAPRGGARDLLDDMLGVLSQMIAAEALQLDARDRLEPDEGRYFRVVQGKTAALFGWAMRAGATAGRLSADVRDALSRFACGLGVAFQLVDDALDYAGDADTTGKGVFEDLKEGKLTYPLLVGMQRDPTLRDLLERAVPERRASLGPEIRARLEHCGALDRTREEARARLVAACRDLEVLPRGPARWALGVVAAAMDGRVR